MTHTLSLPNHKQLIYSLYIEGYSRVEISKRLKLNINTISQTLLNEFKVCPKRAGRKSKYDSLMPSFIEDYQQGYSIRAIAQKYGVTDQVIRRCLKRNGIEIASIRRDLIKDFDFAYFDEINPFKAYQLGQLWASVLMSDPEEGIIRFLLPKKKNYLFQEMFQGWVSSPFTQRQTNDDTLMEVSYHHVGLCQFFNELGLNQGYPTCLPPHHSEFWRGYFSVQVDFLSDGLKIGFHSSHSAEIKHLLCDYLNTHQLSSDAIIIDEAGITITGPQMNKQLLKQLPFLEDQLMKETITTYWLEVLCA